MQRQIMSSEALKKSYYEYYNKFFVSHDLILSVPNILHWGNVLGKINSSIKIKQKLPTKMYIGVNYNSYNKIKLGYIKYFSQQDAKFKIKNLGDFDHNIEEVENQLQEIFIKYGINKGITLDLFSENGLGRGLSLVGIISVLLSTTILLLSNQLDIELLQEDKIYQDTKLQKKIFDLSIEISNKISNLYQILDGTISGTVQITSLLKEWLPIIYYGSHFDLNENYDNNIENIIKNGIVNNHLKSFDESSLPYECGIISYGLSYNSRQMIGIYKNFKKEFQENMDYLQQFENFDFESDEKLVSGLSNYLHGRIIKSISDMFDSPYDENHTNEFIKNISNLGFFNIFVEKSSSILVDTHYLFKKLQSYPNEKLGLMPLTSGRAGGTFMFFVHRDISRDTIYKLYSSLKENGYKNISLEYLSWEDGYEDNTLSIPQFISKGLYSDYVKESTVLFENNYGEKYIGDHREILFKEKSMIIFDTIDKKMYINGKIISHKDLRSHSGTVEIMSNIYKLRNGSINNSNLPPSSYSKNKNELLGKILIPLEKIIKKYYKKSLPIKCSGSLYDFDIFWEDKTQFKFGILKRMQSFG